MKLLMLYGLAGAAFLVGASAPASAADAKAGEAAFAKCGICHQLGPNAQIVVGPPLNGIVGKTAAAYEGFAYSPGMKRLGEEGYKWTEEKPRRVDRQPEEVAARGAHVAHLSRHFRRRRAGKHHRLSE
jgi:cytochrome c2